MSLQSYTCKGCTNICHLIFKGEVKEYCKPVIYNGGHRTEWQGDYLACLDYTTDPDAEDKEVRVHPDEEKDMRWYVKAKLEAEYDDIEAEDEEEAFDKAIEYAIAGGEWDYIAAPAEEEDDGQITWSEYEG